MTATVVGVAFLLLLSPREPERREGRHALPMGRLSSLAAWLLILVTLANAAAAFALCGPVECPDNPTSYFTGERVKADWQGQVKLQPGETLVLGAEHQRDGISLPISASTTIDSGYAELASNPVPNLNATLAVRYDANSGFGGQVTWRFA